jgi:hypothetical protein
MIPKSNESTFNVTKLYGGFTASNFNDGNLASNIIQGLKVCGFANVAQISKSQGHTMLYFGAKTVNNLPLLLEVNAV